MPLRGGATISPERVNKGPYFRNFSWSNILRCQYWNSGGGGHLTLKDNQETLIFRAELAKYVQGLYLTSWGGQ